MWCVIAQVGGESVGYVLQLVSRRIQTIVTALAPDLRYRPAPALVVANILH